MTANPALTPGAACRSVDPDLFFPEPGRRMQARRAAEICGGCPLLTQCAAWAAPQVHAQRLTDCVVAAVQVPASSAALPRFDTAAAALAEVALLGHVVDDTPGWAA